MSDGYEIEELPRIEAALDALVSPTSADVFQATRPFDERAIASVAAKRAGDGSGGSQPVLVSTTELSSAQILALHSSPVDLVPAQAGFVVWPVTAALLYKAGATPYDQQGGSERIVWSGQNEPGDTVFSENTGPGDAIVFFNLMHYFEGVALVGDFTGVTIDNTVANPTGGDGTAVVTVWYVLVPTT